MKKIISFALGVIAGAATTAAIMTFQIRDMIQLLEEVTAPGAPAEPAANAADFAAE